MNFLDVPSSSAASLSFMLEETKLGAGRPELEPPISFPGQSAGPSKLQAQTITPLASFLLKSYLDKEASVFIPSTGSSTTFPPKLKTFINVTHHHLVPAPPSPANKATGSSTDAWVPGVVGDVSVTVDKVGNPSLLIDVILNTEVHTKLKKDAEYKLYIIQVALKKVEDKLSIELSRNYSLPKTLPSKGPLLPRSVVLPSTSSTSASSSPPSSSPILTSSASSEPIASEPLLSASSTTRINSSLPRAQSTFVFDVGNWIFTLTYLVPLVQPLPTEDGKTARPNTTLEFVEPGIVRFGIEGMYAVSEDDVCAKDVKLGGRKVDPKGWEAEWLVGEGKVVVQGRMMA